MSDLRQEFEEKPSEEAGEVRDPRPDVELRQDFWSFMGDYIYLNHVAPMTSLYVEDGDSPILLNFLDVEREQKQDLMYFKERPSMIIGNHGSV